MLEDDNNLDNKVNHSENEKHNEENLKNSKATSVKTTLISIMVVVAIIFSLNAAINLTYEICYSYDEENEEDEEDYDEDISKYAVNFIREYEKAKENFIAIDEVEVDDYGRVMFKNEELYSDDNFSINIADTYLYRYDYDLDSHLRCIDFPTKSKTRDGTCAIDLLENYDVKQNDSPEDFIKALEENNIKLTDKYLVKNTKHKIIYSIGVFTYSQEYIDLIKKWLENGDFE